MLSYGMGSGTLKKKKDQNALSLATKACQQRYQSVDNWLMFKYKQQMSKLPMH